jgi:HAD superfamily hydrolase (TIGR01458 family)
MAFDFSRVRGLLFDMDGVWFVGEAPVPGAVETLAHIRSKGLPCRFVTNTTTRSLDDLVAKMARFGLDIERDEIVTAPRATALFLRERGAPSCHLLVDDNVRAEFTDFPLSDRPDYVVVGDIGERWNYRVLDEAFRMLIAGAELVAMHKGRYWQVEDGLALDIGAFVAGLEYASGKRATLVGKPAPTIFRSALADLGLAASEVAMVGDDVHSDVGGAQGVGITGVLVETGKYRADLVAASGVTPHAVLESVADLNTLL